MSAKPTPLRIGLIGASRVATYAVIAPARRLQDVEVAGIAARDRARAEAYAEAHGIGQVYAMKKTTLLRRLDLDISRSAFRSPLTHEARDQRHKSAVCLMRGRWPSAFGANFGCF